MDDSDLWLRILENESFRCPSCRDDPPTFLAWSNFCPRCGSALLREPLIGPRLEVASYFARLRLDGTAPLREIVPDVPDDPLDGIRRIEDLWPESRRTGPPITEEPYRPRPSGLAGLLLALRRRWLRFLLGRKPLPPGPGALGVSDPWID